MRSACVGLLLILALAACTGEKPAQPAPGGTQGEGAEADVPVATPVDVTPGDVEQQVFISATVDEADRGPTVKVDQIEDPRHRVNLVNVDVYQPYPAQLPIRVSMDSKRNWAETPVAIRGKVVVEGRPEALGELSTVLGKQGASADVETKVDLMKAFPQPPDSVLVMWRGDAFLMPVGTDETTVDPATATAPEDRATQLMSNAVRVNFHPEPMPASSEAPAAPEAPAVPAAPEAAPAPAVPAPAPEASAPAEPAP